jgi:hypothetical protein
MILVACAVRLAWEVTWVYILPCSRWQQQHPACELSRGFVHARSPEHVQPCLPLCTQPPQVSRKMLQVKISTPAAVVQTDGANTGVNTPWAQVMTRAGGPTLVNVPGFLNMFTGPNGVTSIRTPWGSADVNGRK